MFDVGDSLTLSDGREYVIVSNATLDGKTYYYLGDIKEPTNVKFFVERIADKVYMDEIKDEETIKMLYPLFEKSTKKFLKKN